MDQPTDSRTGIRSTRILLLGVLDVAVAGAVAIGVFRLIGASSGDDTNPPVCSNYAGGNVSCSLTAPVVMLPTFAIVLFALVAFQLIRRRRSVSS
jgi:hypothetical protein